MTASIAHEVNQPLAAVVANGHACLRWLSASPPNLPKAAEAAQRIVKDGKDAGEVVRRVRALFQRTHVEKVPLDLSEVIGEVLRLLDSYPPRAHVSLDVALDPNLPPVFADRVQLQQLLLNLMVNGLEALEPVSGRVKQCRSDRSVPRARPRSRFPITGSASTIPWRHSTPDVGGCQLGARRLGRGGSEIGTVENDAHFTHAAARDRGAKHRRQQERSAVAPCVERFAGARRTGGGGALRRRRP
jgi:hypothetical protein